MVLVALAMVVSACGTDQTETGGVSAPSSAPTTTAATVPPTTSQAPDATVDPKAVEDYLVAMTNLDGDLGDRLSEFEQSYNDDAQSRFGEEPSEEEQGEYFRGYMSGTIEILAEHVAMMEALAAPAGFQTAHSDYVNAYQSWVDQMRTDTSGLTTTDEFEGYFGMVFFGIELTPAMESLMLAQATSCRTLEQLGNDAGYSVHLGCPQEPVEPLTVDVQVGGPWMADPNPLAATEGDIDMTLTNVGDDPVQVVVIAIFEGDPTNLPVVDGVVDLSLSGAIDPSSGFASFGVGYPDVFGEGDSKVGEVAALDPGETAEITLFGGSDVFVVFDYRAGEFEAGNYVVIERDGT